MAKGWITRLSVMIMIVAVVACTAGPEAVPTFVPPTLDAEPTGGETFLSRPTYTITRDTLRDELSVRGELVAADQEVLYFPVSGILREIEVAPGESVVAGTVLARLSAPSLEQQALQRAADLTIRQLELARLEAGSPPTETLAETSAVVFNLAIARERMSLADALYAHTESLLAQTVLLAPFDGTVVNFTKQLGGRVDPYESVGVLADLSALRVEAMVPVAQRERVSMGDGASVRIDGFPNRTYSGVVIAVDEEPNVRQGMPTYAMTVALDAGQAPPPVTQIGADVALVGAIRENVPWIPINALVNVGDQTYVDLLTETRIERVPVTLGVVSGQRAEVVAGVAAGDVIVFP